MLQPVRELGRVKVLVPGRIYSEITSFLLFSKLVFLLSSFYVGKGFCVCFKCPTYYGCCWGRGFCSRTLGATEVTSAVTRVQGLAWKLISPGFWFLNSYTLHKYKPQYKSTNLMHVLMCTHHPCNIHLCAQRHTCHLQPIMHTY